MFRKFLNREIDDRLQSRLDMISGLFEEPSEFVSEAATRAAQTGGPETGMTGSADAALAVDAWPEGATPETHKSEPARPAMSRAAAREMMAAHRSSIAAGKSRSESDEPLPTLRLRNKVEEDGAPQAPPLVRRSGPIPKPTGAMGLVSRLRGEEGGDDPAMDSRPVRSIPVAPPLPESLESETDRPMAAEDEPLSLGARQLHVEAEDPAVLRLTGAAEAPTAKTAAPARRNKEAALVLRLTPDSSVQRRGETARAAAPETKTEAPAAAPEEPVGLAAPKTEAAKPEAPEPLAAPEAKTEKVPEPAAVAKAEPEEAPEPVLKKVEAEATVEAPAVATPASSHAPMHTDHMEFLREGEAAPEAAPEPVKATKPEPEPKSEPVSEAPVQSSNPAPGVRNGGILPIDGLEHFIGEPFVAGVGFTPVVAIVTGTDRFVLRTARLVLEDVPESGRRLGVAWFHSSPSPLPVLNDDSGEARAEHSVRMLGMVVSALRDDHFDGNIVDYAGFVPGSDEAKLARNVLDLVFAAAEDLVGRGLEPDLTPDGQLPTPSKLMQAAFVEWSGGPRKTETHEQAFRRLTAAREPGRLSVAPPAGRERADAPAGASERRIGFAS